MNAGRFFFEFPADQACGSVYTTAVKKVSKNMNMLWHYKAVCIYTHVSLSGICIVNVMLVYPQQTMY